LGVLRNGVGTADVAARYAGSPSGPARAERMVVMCGAQAGCPAALRRSQRDGRDDQRAQKRESEKEGGAAD
jgi:hypothetical protein